MSETEGMVRLGIFAYKCSFCDAIQLHAGEFAEKGGVLAPACCSIIRGEDGYICGAKMDQASASKVLELLRNATDPVTVES